jgi:hypothetical protein
MNNVNSQLGKSFCFYAGRLEVVCPQARPFLLRSKGALTESLGVVSSVYPFCRIHWRADSHLSKPVRG